MARIKTLTPFFEKGIDSVTFKGAEQVSDLPALYDLAPAELPHQTQTDQLLAAPTFDDFLLETLLPEIHDPELLKPLRFSQTLGELRGNLESLAKSLEASDPDAAKAMRRAVRLLNDEVELRELLRANRAALYQG